MYTVAGICSSLLFSVHSYLIIHCLLRSHAIKVAHRGGVHDLNSPPPQIWSNLFCLSFSVSTKRVLSSLPPVSQNSKLFITWASGFLNEKKNTLKYLEKLYICLSTLPVSICWIFRSRTMCLKDPMHLKEYFQGLETCHDCLIAYTTMR
jgi:hypothetical protein